MEIILFSRRFPANVGKNSDYKIRETFQKCYKVNLLNQIHNGVII